MNLNCSLILPIHLYTRQIAISLSAIPPIHVHINHIIHVLVWHSQATSYMHVMYFYMYLSASMGMSILLWSFYFPGKYMYIWNNGVPCSIQVHQCITCIYMYTCTNCKVLVDLCRSDVYNKFNVGTCTGIVQTVQCNLIITNLL